MNDNLIEILIPVIFFAVVFFINYINHRCPKCKTWHFFRRDLIILDKLCDKHDREWAKCKKCGYESEIYKQAKDYYLGGGTGE